MSDEIRKGVGGPGDEPEKDELPDREEVMPKDHELYTPQGGGGGTGSGPIGEVAAVRDESAGAPFRGPEPLILSQIGPESAGIDQRLPHVNFVIAAFVYQDPASKRFQADG